MSIPLKIFKSLADETRLRLFYLLTSYELNVNELVEVLQMGQSRVSRHLRILSDSGLVICRRDGSFVYYYAEQNEVSRLLVEFVSRFLDQQIENAEDLSRAEEIIAERRRRTRRFFNQVADSWDRLKQDLLGETDLEQILESYLTQTGTAVDLGCGTGDLLKILARYADFCIGVDASAKMLEQAKEKVKKIQARFEFRLGELEHLPLKDAEAELAVVNMVLHHLPVPALGIDEAYRILSQNGVFLIAELDKYDSEEIKRRFGGPWMGFKKEEVVKWLKDAGFSIQDTAEYAVSHGLKINVFAARK